MVAIGMGLLWVGYALILFGYTKVLSADLTILDLVVPGKFDACRWATTITNAKVAPKANSC